MAIPILLRSGGGGHSLSIEMNERGGHAIHQGKWPLPINFFTEVLSIALQLLITMIEKCLGAPSPGLTKSSFHARFQQLQTLR